MTLNSTNSASADSKTDQIASLLTGGADEVESQVDADDAQIEDEVVDQEDQSDSEEVDENQELPEESTEVDESEDETTWEAVLGVTEDKLKIDDQGNLTGVNVKVNGESSTVSLNDLIVGYQTNKSNTQKAQALAEERKAFDAQRTNLEADYTSKLEMADKLTDFLSNKMAADFENIDWARLRIENPAEYAALHQDYSSKLAEVQEAKRAISDEIQTLRQSHMTDLKAKQLEYVQDQFQKMLQRNPTWEDESVRMQDMASYKTFLSGEYGFTDNDFSQVTDARLIELIKDAKKYHDGVKAVSKKTAKKIPKFQKSTGSAPIKRTTKLDKLTKAVKSAKGSEKRALQSSAIAELLLGG